MSKIPWGSYCGVGQLPFDGAPIVAGNYTMVTLRKEGLQVMSPFPEKKT